MPDFNRDRREFLIQGSSLLLGAAALGYANADEKQPAVRVAVVGTGARGSDLVRALTTIERAEIVAVCDDYEPHLARGRKYAGEQAKAFTSFAKMLKETSPQAVVVAAPLHLHFEMCRDALDAGCDVFCEKMMCYSLDQAKELAALATKKKAVFQVGLQRRANAVYRQAAAMVETGMLGRIVTIKCQWHRHGDWRRPVPVPRGDAGWSALEQRLNWRLYRKSSQGLMAELGSHQLDVANWLLGKPPARILGSGGIDHWRDGREVCDNVFCVYEYEVPVPRDPKAPKPSPEKSEPASYTVRVTYSSVQNNAYEGASELVEGTKGTLFLTPKKGLFFREDTPPAQEAKKPDDEASVLTSGKTLKMTNDPWAFRGKPFEIDTESDDTRDELVSFLECVQSRDAKTICDAAAGVVNTATVLMANQAIAEHKTVSWPREVTVEKPQS
jgi:predicted dehydrogenase